MNISIHCYINILFTKGKVPIIIYIILILDFKILFKTIDILLS